MCPHGGSAYDGNAFSSDQLTSGWVVRPSQVVQIWRGTVRLLIASQTLILLPAHHLALVRDCLDIILILVARLIKGMLERNKGGLVRDKAKSNKERIISFEKLQI